MNHSTAMLFATTVNYRTRLGRHGVWTGEVLATWDTVHEVATAAARRARRALAKIDGSAARPAVWTRP